MRQGLGSPVGASVIYSGLTSVRPTIEIIEATPMRTMIGRFIDSDAMNRRAHIDSDLSVVVVKPIVRGIRLSVEFLLGVTAEGWAEKQIIECYPQVGPEALQTMFTLVAECTRDERVYGIGVTTGETPHGHNESVPPNDVADSSTTVHTWHT